MTTQRWIIGHLSFVRIVVTSYKLYVPLQRTGMFCYNEKMNVCCRSKCTYVVGVCMHTKLSPLLNCAHGESPRQQASALGLV
jgi:hypothetical protein